MARIKIIDDDVEFADNIATLLRDSGYEVSALDTTLNAIDVLKDDMPDLLILDVMFPDNPAGGFDLARGIRRDPQIRDLPVILLTGVNQEFPMDFTTHDIDPEWMPVQDLVEKPVAMTSLLASVRRLLDEPPAS
jgi:CheY-like chemotaxis protein